MSKQLPEGVQNLTLTENGAATNASSLSARLDFFFQVVPSSPPDAVCNLVAASWTECPLDTLKLIFQLRDVRGGKNERRCFYICLGWLLAKHPETFLANLHVVPEFGYWKDLLELLLAPQNRSGKTLKGEGEDLTQAKNFPRFVDMVVDLFAAQIKVDLAAMEKGEQASLCAKWAPSPGKKYDKLLKLARKIADKAFGGEGLTSSLEIDSANYKETPALYQYRKALAKLRAFTNVPELKMSAKKWNAIKYTHVPSVCMANNRKIFLKRDKERYEQYLADVAKGTTTIASGALLPHLIVSTFMNGQAQESDVTLELQWKDKVAKLKKDSKLPTCLSVVDVSGSMSGIPMQVAIALGLILAELTEGTFHDHVVTFHSNPSLFKLKTGGTVRERVQHLKRAPWGGSTNFAKVFDLILERAATSKCPAAELPEIVFCFSDMEFDQAQTGAFRTTHEEIKLKFIAMGFKMPQLVYWNLRHSSSIPVTKEEPGVSMVSGFSPAMLNLFLAGEELSPWQTISKAIEGEKFDKFKVVD